MNMSIRLIGSQEVCCSVEARDGRNICPPSRKAMSPLLDVKIVSFVVFQVAVEAPVQVFLDSDCGSRLPRPEHC